MASYRIKLTDVALIKGGNLHNAKEELIKIKKMSREERLAYAKEKYDKENPKPAPKPDKEETIYKEMSSDANIGKNSYPILWAIDKNFQKDKYIQSNSGWTITKSEDLTTRIYSSTRKYEAITIEKVTNILLDETLINRLQNDFNSFKSEYEQIWDANNTRKFNDITLLEWFYNGCSNEIGDWSSINFPQNGNNKYLYGFESEYYDLSNGKINNIDAINYLFSSIEQYFTAEKIIIKHHNGNYAINYATLTPKSDKMWLPYSKPELIQEGSELDKLEYIYKTYQFNQNIDINDYPVLWSSDENFQNDGYIRDNSGWENAEPTTETDKIYRASREYKNIIISEFTNLIFDEHLLSTHLRNDFTTFVDEYVQEWDQENERSFDDITLLEWFYNGCEYFATGDSDISFPDNGSDVYLYGFESDYYDLRDGKLEDDFAMYYFRKTINKYFDITPITISLHGGDEYKNYIMITPKSDKMWLPYSKPELIQEGSDSDPDKKEDIYFEAPLLFNFDKEHYPILWSPDENFQNDKYIRDNSGWETTYSSTQTKNIFKSSREYKHITIAEFTNLIFDDHLLSTHLRNDFEEFYNFDYNHNDWDPENERSFDDITLLEWFYNCCENEVDGYSSVAFPSNNQHFYLYDFQSNYYDFERYFNETDNIAIYSFFYPVISRYFDTKEIEISLHGGDLHKNYIMITPKSDKMWLPYNEPELYRSPSSEEGGTINPNDHQNTGQQSGIGDNELGEATNQTGNGADTGSQSTSGNQESGEGTTQNTGQQSGTGPQIDTGDNELGGATETNGSQTVDPNQGNYTHNP